MRADRETFGPRLKRERERRGVALEAIADSTKIKRSLLAGLEANDVSRWPSGIFRRAFVREYAAAIGLDPEEIVAEFVRLFPEPGEEPPHAPLDGPEDVPAAPSSELRLALDDQAAAGRLRPRIVAVLAELGVVLLVAGMAALAGLSPFGPTAAAVAIAWSAASTLMWGRSPVLEFLETGGLVAAGGAPADGVRSRLLPEGARDETIESSSARHGGDAVRHRPALRAVVPARVPAGRRDEAGRQRPRHDLAGRVENWRPGPADPPPPVRSGRRLSAVRPD